MEGNPENGGIGSGGVEWLWIGLFLLTGYSLALFGSSLLSMVVQGIAALLQPLLYGAGWVVQFLLEVLWRYRGEVEMFPPSAENPKAGSPHVDATETVTVFSEGWEWLGPLLLGAVWAGVFLFLFRRIQRKRPLGEGKSSSGEIREFISVNRKPDKKVVEIPYSSFDTWMGRLYRRFLLRMKRAGYPRFPDETPREYIHRMATPRIIPGCGNRWKH